MKTLLKFSLMILLTAFAGQMQSAANNEYTRVIKKEFPVNPDAQLTVSNKFGKIHCTNWDKNIVAIEVQVVVETANDNTAAKMLEKIDVKFSASASVIEATTIFEEMHNSGRTSFRVDYTINLPAGMSLDLANKFGDIYVNETNGKAKINLSYGSLDINKLNNSDNLIDLKFCNSSKVREIKGAVINLQYSTLDIDFAGSLRLDAKYSNLKAGKVIALNISTEGGSIDLNNSAAVESRSKFSDIDIDRIDQSLNLDIQYGSCKVSEVGPDFTSINIKNKFANVDLRLPKSAVYSLDATLKFCELDFPEDNTALNFRSTTPTSSEYRGVVGSKDAKPNATVVVRSDYGRVSLK